jgi:hypothetical protein
MLVKVRHILEDKGFGFVEIPMTEEQMKKRKQKRKKRTQMKNEADKSKKLKEKV